MVVKKGLKYSFSVFGSAPKSCYENVKNLEIKFNRKYSVLVPDCIDGQTSLIFSRHGNKVDLKGKSRTEKLALITQYFNSGYYITAEVKGATPGNQRWVPVTGINGNNILMKDSNFNQTDMWSAY